MRRGIWLLLLSFTAVLPVSVQAQRKSVSAGPVIDRPAIERYVRRLKLVTPQVVVKVGEPKPSPVAGLYELPVHLSFNQVTQEMVLYISRDGRKLVEGNIFDLAQNPFQKQIELLRTENQPAFGAPSGAPLTVVVFSDFECPLCRLEAKTLREKIPAEFGKEARVFFTDFPLEQIHPWARAAAVAGRAVYRLSGAAFWDYHDWAFDHQPELTAENFRGRFLEWAKGKGLDTAHLSRLLDTHAVDGEVDAEIAEGRKLGIDSTPTLFVNGRKLVGQVDWASLSAILKAELSFIK